MSKLLPIQAAYKALLSKNRLTNNPGQQALVDRLAELQNRLTTEANASAVVDPIPTPSRDNGLYIYGDVGTGKSRIADLFAATLPPTVTKRRIHFYEFMMETHARIHRARMQSHYAGDPLVNIGRQICDESRVLCFDEFQVSDIADAMILKRLFGAFWNSGGIMVSTSNRHPTQLYENGLNRPLFVPFIDELQRRCHVWKIEGKRDYRMSKEQHQDDNICFFTDEEQFRVSLSKATGNRALSPVQVRTTTNRELTVQAVKEDVHSAANGGKSIVHATFDSLCKANLGSIDYHSLCKFASTIYLSGLRQFEADELDFIRRFITLIDIAYESKVRLVCCSNAPLMEVFRNVIVPPHLKAFGGLKHDEDNKPVLEAQGKLREALLDRNLSVKGEGGSSSSMMSTYIGNVEWSATGLREASLATGGAGETDVRFAVGRAVSRLYEMNSTSYAAHDD